MVEEAKPSPDMMPTRQFCFYPPTYRILRMRPVILISFLFSLGTFLAALAIFIILSYRKELTWHTLTKSSFERA